MAVLFAILVVASSNVYAERIFNIPRTSASSGLKLYAEQAGRQVLFPFDVVRRFVTNAVEGSYDVDEALRLLLQGTGLEAVSDPSGVLTIHMIADRKEMPLPEEQEAMSNDKKPFFSGITALLSSMFAVSPGFAQDAQTAAPDMVEEIIVTAQKRAESVQDVPISIQALTGDDLNQYGVKRADDILGLFANVGSVTQAETNRNFFIRGVGTNDFHLNSVGAVGIYLDEVSITSPYGSTFSLFDMERVEVMRGPQNTLFGRNTTGGAVNYISRKPRADEGLNGYASAGYGRYDQLDLEGAVGVALGDNAAARIAVSSNQRDGTFDNLTLDKAAGERDRQAWRAQLAWDATADLSLLLNFHGGVSNGEGRPWKNVGFLDPLAPYVLDPGTGAFVPNPCSVPVDDLLVENNVNCADSSGFVHQYEEWEDVFNGLPLVEKLDLWGGFVRADWQWGTLTLTSVTSYDSTKMRRSEDSDSAPNTEFQFYQQNELDQYSEEFRVTSGSDQKLRWIAGAYYFFEESKYSTAVRRIPPGAQPFLVGAPGTFTILPNTRVEQDNELFSVYWQAEYDLEPDLKATVGLRWTSEEKSGYNRTSVRCAGGAGGPPFCPLIDPGAQIGFDELEAAPVLFELPVERLFTEENIWGSRFALDWTPTDDLLLYGSISRGFKSGGFSIAALQALNGLASQPVDPEILWAYEIGGKSTWLDGSLQVNAAVFYYDWTDLQSFEPFLDPAIGVAIPQLVNVPKSSLLGGEIETVWVPAEGWMVQAGVGLLDSEIDDPGFVIGAAKGNDLPMSPELTFTGLARKEFQIGPGILALQANWRYQDDVTFSLGNARNLSQDGYWNLNARGSYIFGPQQQYEIAIWGENLTDSEYCTTVTSLAGLSESNLCAPNDGQVMYGISALVRFE
jgi:iron complex outermembrane receptor protein